jgi:hypothetical protein
MLRGNVAQQPPGTGDPNGGGAPVDPGTPTGPGATIPGGTTLPGTPTTLPTTPTTLPDTGLGTGAGSGTSLPATDESPTAPALQGDYLELFADVGWIAVLVLAGLAVLFSTLIVPSSFAGRLFTGFLQAALLGLLINAADREGTSAPRVTGALVTLVAAGGFGAALYQLFGDDGAPTPAYGVWAGVGGLAAVLLGCLLGTRRRPVEA